MYHLIRAGSIYEIWAVRPMSDTALYAIKWLPPGSKYDRQNINGLKHEFDVGKDLDHRAVIRSYEFGNTSNGAFILLEFFKTPNLKQQIVSGYKKLHHRLKDVLVEAAAGIAHMHEKGWIHRDIKPDNFLVNEASQVKLIDFNLSRKQQGALGKLFGGKSPVQGTHSYMAPEQIRGQNAGPQADIYSLGCMIHECLTGKPPFTASSPNELLAKHLKTKPPQLVVTDKNIHPELNDFVQQMMAKDPKDRPQTMKDVQMRLKTTRFFHMPPQPPDTAEETEQKKDSE
ncbi:MAG: serine/threonine-protein kinase [Pirellulales bacterium]